MKKLFLLLPFCLLASCQSNCQSLNGNAYQFELDNTPVTIAFDEKENRYYGKVVNNYFGNYTKDNHKITLYAGGSTMMMGPKKAMAVEQKWFELLPQVVAYSQTENSLILTLENGTELKLNKTILPN